MNKLDLTKQINEAYNLFVNDVENLAFAEANLCVNAKWSVNQNFEHINLSLVQLNKYLLLPKERIKLVFGISNQKGSSFADFTLKLKQTLNTGIKSTTIFTPEFNPKITNNLIVEGKQVLNYFTEGLIFWSDEELEIYHCPHPVLGKISAKEMLYFTIFHIKHHHNTVMQRMLNNFK